MSTTYYVLDETKEDKRCQKCKYHKFVIVSIHPDAALYVMHSFVHLVGQGWPYLNFNQGVHWWGAGLPVMNPPECLKSYKKVGGK